jgi:DNA-binding transcriptional MerR regulator
MPLAEIRRYVQAARRGPQTVEERLAILQAHERRVRDEVLRMQDALAVISQKVVTYGLHAEDGTADRSWAEEPTC